MSERKPFLPQSRIEDAILTFFRDNSLTADIRETTVYLDGSFDAYALAVAIERVIDEAMAEQP